MSRLHQQRTILRALTALTDGIDVVLVASPAGVAFDLADSVVCHAAAMGIPCELREGADMYRTDDEVPMLSIRPLGWEALPIRRGDFSRAFVVDASARHERTLTPPTRFVMPLESR